MSFEEFQNRARLFVIGALEADEMEEFEQARREFGEKAEAFIAECYSLSEAFALSLKPASASDQIKTRLMEMVKNRQTR
jgi:phosphopantetheinyl transferase (holo-ACP synthase)